MTEDHVIPRVLGGPSERWNLVDACGSCNAAKGRLTYEEFTGEVTLPLKSKFATTLLFLEHLDEVDARTPARHRLSNRTLQKLEAARKRVALARSPAWVADLRGPPPYGGW